MTSARTIALRSHFGAERGPAALAVLHFAFLAGDPLGAGVEPTSVGGYARPAVANDAALWGVLPTEAVSVTLAAPVEWPSATGIWSEAECSHWAIYDNAAGGTPIYSGALSIPVRVTGAGDRPRIPAGALTITQL